MHIKLYPRFFMAATMVAFGVAALGQSAGSLTKERVLFLLPLGTDSDVAAEARYKELLSHGEAIHPILAQIASETDDRHTLAVILGTLELSGSQKPAARAIVRSILKRFEKTTGPNAEALRQHAVRALGSIGTKDDIPVLLPLLESEEEFLRTNAARSLGKLGDETTVAQIDEAFGKVSARANVGALEKQRLLEEREVARGAIKKRLKEQRDGNAAK